MKNLNKFFAPALMGAALLVGANTFAETVKVSGTDAVIIMNGGTEENPFSNVTYKNDIHDDNSYWPNWTIQFGGDAKCKATAFSDVKFTYTVTKDGEPFTTGTVNRANSAEDEAVIHSYATLGVLSAGEYVLSTTISYIYEEKECEVVCPEVAFSATDAAFVKPTISIEGLNPVAETATTGKVDYKLTVTNPQEVLKYTVFVVSAGQEGKTPTPAGDVTAAMLGADILLGQTSFDAVEGKTEYTGSIDLSELIANGTTGMWFKAFAHLSDESETGLVQMGAVNIDTSSVTPDAFTMSIHANSNPTSATTGDINYVITPSNPEDVESYTLWVVYQGVNGDIEVGRLEETENAEGVVNLNNLPSKANTPIWIKATAKLKNGSTYPSNGQPQVIYPGEPENFQGFTINTTDFDPTAVSNIETDQTESAIYFNAQGVRVTHPEKGLFIRVQGKTATKVIF